MAVLEPLDMTDQELGGGATYNSANPFRIAPRYKRFCGGILTDQAGTVNLQLRTATNATFRTLQTFALVANTPATWDFVWPWGGETRVQIVNGATPQTDLIMEAWGSP